MSFRVMQSLVENASARDELARAGLSCWPGHVLPESPFTVGDPRKSWDVLATLRLLEAERLQNETIVDFGAFASEILCCLHRAKFKRLVGIDSNPAVKDMPFADAIEWRVGDMMATGLTAGSAGAVTSISAIEHGFDLDRLLAEVARLLRPGGLLIGSTDYWPERSIPMGSRYSGWIGAFSRRPRFSVSSTPPAALASFLSGTSRTVPVPAASTTKTVSTPLPGSRCANDQGGPSALAVGAPHDRWKSTTGCIERFRSPQCGYST